MPTYCALHLHARDLGLLQGRRSIRGARFSFSNLPLPPFNPLPRPPTFLRGHLVPNRTQHLASMFRSLQILLVSALALFAIVGAVPRPENSPKPGQDPSREEITKNLRGFMQAALRDDIGRLRQIWGGELHSK